MLHERVNEVRVEIIIIYGGKNEREDPNAIDCNCFAKLILCDSSAVVLNDSASSMRYPTTVTKGK